jgi:hypothetical protein
MGDKFESVQEGLTAPASQGVAIVPSSTTDLPFVTRAIYVGTAGDLAVVMRTGGTVTFASVPAGTLLPIRALRVLETSTAGSLVGLA